MKIEAYAKINLTLEVFAKRVDGYHALRSIVQPIALADTLEIEETNDGVIATDTGYGEEDLIVKAARVLMHATGMSRHLSSGVCPKGDATFLSREQKRNTKPLRALTSLSAEPLHSASSAANATQSASFQTTRPVRDLSAIIQASCSVSCL